MDLLDPLLQSRRNTVQLTHIKLEKNTYFYIIIYGNVICIIAFVLKRVHIFHNKFLLVCILSKTFYVVFNNRATDSINKLNGQM